jgi:N4-gp56 family major capsid protein|tara:strand:- start:2763 stop:3719 length:957 start_codon:yes stop_codon:yes gene_type:complete
MAVELIGVNGMTVENKQFYDGLLIRRAIPKFHYITDGKQVDIPARGGNSIEFRGLARLTGTTGALTEGSSGAEIQATFTNVAATVAQYGKFLKLSDVLELQAIDPVLSEYVGALGEQMGDSLDLVVRGVVVGGTTIQYASTAGSRAMVGSGMNMSWAEIREAVGTLERANTPRFDDGTFHVIAHTDTKEDMFADTTVVDNWQEAGVRGEGNPLFTGQITGSIYGTSWRFTTNGSIQSSAGLSGADVYQTVFYGKDYYAVTAYSAEQARVIIHPRGTSGLSDPLNQISTVGWKAAITAARLNNSFAVVLEHATSQSTAA